jgi:hypothetical protein
MAHKNVWCVCVCVCVCVHTDPVGSRGDLVLHTGRWGNIKQEQPLTCICVYVYVYICVYVYIDMKHCFLSQKMISLCIHRYKVITHCIHILDYHSHKCVHTSYTCPKHSRRQCRLGSGFFFFFFFFFLLFWFFETEFLCVTQAVLELTLKTRLASNSGIFLLWSPRC